MTYQDERNAVVDEIVRLTGWPRQEADNITGEIDDAIADGMTPSEIARVFIRLAEEESL